MNKKNRTRSKKNKIIILLLTLLLILSVLLNVFLFKNNKKNIIKKDVIIKDENIVFFGDSITHQYTLEKFYPKNIVINSGIDGNVTKDLIGRIENDVYRYNPSKVFLLIGINDKCRDVSDKDILKNIQKIINGIKINRKYSDIYVESIYPLNHKEFENNNYNYCKNVDNDKIIELNKKIKDVCNESNVTYIDVYNKLTDKDGELKSIYTVEGLHLNDLGYLKVTTILNDYIK